MNILGVLVNLRIIISIMLIILGIICLIIGLWLLGVAAFNEGIKQVGLVSSIRGEAIVMKITGLILLALGVTLSLLNGKILRSRHGEAVEICKET